MSKFYPMTVAQVRQETRDTLVATFAAASLWQQWRSVEVEQADRGGTTEYSGWRDR